MSSEPRDEVVEHAIQSTLSTMSTSVRPNKLRKIICKQIEDTNWTQYQRVLDRLVENQCIQLQEINGEKLIVVSKAGDSQSTMDTNVEIMTQKVDGNNSRRTDQRIDREEITIPFEIFLHLTKKGRKKQKNIETNTKTKISFDNETSTSMRLKENTQGSTCTVIITKTYIIEEGMDEDEAREKAQKQIKSAKLYITKMIQSFEKNPDHFVPPKAGGTFAEQAEAKQRKAETAQMKKKKKLSNGDKRKNLSTTNDSSSKIEEDENGIKTKKVRRKYY